MADYVHNQKARFNYEILDEYETGIELFGYEVKAIRQNKGQLDGARILIRGGEAYLVNFDLPPYQPGNTSSVHDPLRTRKLLLRKRDIQTLADKEHEKGLTIIPLGLYNKGRKIKLKIALVRGKKKFDKRETIKKRDVDREIHRVVKTYR